VSRFKTNAAPLTRAEILDAAMRHARSGTLEQLSLRALADELDVTPMALYRHVRDKDDILESVADALLGEAGLPEPDEPAPAYLVALAVSLRQVVRDHPSIMALYTRRPQVRAMAVARLDGARQVLVRAGYTVDDAQRIYAAVHTYTLGFCALETARQAAGTPPPTAGQEDTDALIAGFVTEEQFRYGLGALIAGATEGSARA
jgi:TetR/AcrR family transcriptional regulator, tetracycline repressor protein